MVDTPVVTGTELGTALEAQPKVEPTPAVQPTEPASAVQSDLRWIDSLGQIPEPVQAQPVPSYTPRYEPPPTQQQQYPPQVPTQPGALTPGQLINEFVRDPEGFVSRVAERRAGEQVRPFVETAARYMEVVHAERVNSALESSRSYLRNYAQGDSSLSNPQIAREVNNTYAYFRKNADRGNEEAIRTLQNPATPFLATQAAKLKFGMVTQNQSGPVIYQGGMTETRSTATATAPQTGPVPQAELDLAKEWGIDPAKAKANYDNYNKQLNMNHPGKR